MPSAPRLRLVYSNQLTPIFPVPPNRPGAPNFPLYAVLDRDTAAASALKKVGDYYMSPDATGLGGERLRWNVGSAGVAQILRARRPNLAQWNTAPAF